MSERPTEGWGMPRGARKFHYFRETMALCRRYGFYTAHLEADNGEASVDDCAKCRRLLDAESDDA